MSRKHDQPPPRKEGGARSTGAGFTVTSSLTISAAKLAYEPSVRLLTGNGPQAIDQQAAKPRSVLTSTRAARRAGGKQLSK
jgi:hypothetical protein